MYQLLLLTREKSSDFGSAGTEELRLQMSVTSN